jgi:membrane protein
VFFSIKEKFIEKNNNMRKLIEIYKYFSSKQYSTISGTLVYFLLMSIAPFLFWLTLFAGNIDFENIFSVEIFSAIKPMVTYLKTSAENAANSAGIILLVTSLYSSTNFFYHLRRSGEIIYEEHNRKGGLRLRLSALAIIIGAIASVALIAVIPIFGKHYLSTFMPTAVANMITYAFISIIAFFVALMLNMFACPYKLPFDSAAVGSLLTTALWLALAIGFTIYMRFANPSKLYGAVASIIVFLLWSYIMMNCLVIGIIYNQMHLKVKREKRLF